MQNKNEYNLPLRSRYYQAQLDVGGLKPGEDYTNLKLLYVIFICNFDPFKEELYRYTFSMQCEERNIFLNDGVKRIFLNTKGKNKDEVSTTLVDFLGYLNDSTDSYVKQNSNEKIREIHERIKILKKNRDVEERYMHYLYVDKLIEEKENALKEAENALKETEAVLKEVESTARETENALKETENTLKETENTLKEAEAVMKDMIFEAVNELGAISEDISERIKSEKDINILKSIHKIAVKSDSLKQFEEQTANL